MAGEEDSKVNNSKLKILRWFWLIVRCAVAGALDAADEAGEEATR
jgi:hypothetical protein